ncbi:MAG: hypothetical protein P4L34_04930 [Paludibacter sp.]|nr:hypothetical protein [Paludibacter sp.]
MPDRSRIPRLISTFNQYIFNTSSYLAAGTPVNNATRLGLTEAEANSWAKLAEEWKPLFNLYSNKKISRTVAIKDQLMNIIRKTVELDRTNHILTRIGASTQVTIEDMGIFRIKQGMGTKRNHTIPQTPISEQVSVTLQPIGGGIMRVKCYGTSSVRAGITRNADSVQFLYRVGKTPPTSADEAGLSKDLSSKAIFMLSLGADSSGNYLYIYFRWYNMRHPKLAGPWSSLNITAIL